jgi:hypothetical protein
MVLNESEDGRRKAVPNKPGGFSQETAAGMAQSNTTLGIRGLQYD